MKTSIFAVAAILAFGASAPSVVALDADALAAHAAKIPTKLEIKDDASISGTVDEIKSLIEKQGQTVKALNDEVDGLKGRQEDYIQKEKMDKINDEITNLSKQLQEIGTAVNRPGGVSGDGENVDVKEHKDAFFNKFVRKGDENGLTELQEKAMSIGSDADGGYAVPEEFDRELIQLGQKRGAMRKLARTIQVSTEGFKKLANLGGTVSGWVGETDARTATATSQLTPITPPMGEIYANPAATQRSLDDVMFDVEDFIMQEVAKEFAKQEGIAFLSGSGTNQPKGLLTYTTALTDDDSRAFGTMQHFATGVAADLPGTDKDIDNMLLDLIYGLKTDYLPGASWMMNRTLVGRMRKLRDANNQPLWQPATAAGEPSTLHGYGLEVDDHMPNVGAGNIPIAFGDYKEGYYILDRIGTRILRDPFTNKPNVHFYTTKRVGGGVVNSEAIKFIKCTT